MGDKLQINLGELSKPATVFVQKISAAVSGIYRPYQVVRVAKAEAEAAIITAESQIHVTELHRRAVQRLFDEEARKQANMENIVGQALPRLSEDSKPENVDDDWIANFFDRCRSVSNEDMQQLWAGILAGEANEPGTYSRRTVNLVADLDSADAKMFGCLCSFGWNIDDKFSPLVFDLRKDIYKEGGLDFDAVVQLESLGLVNHSAYGGFVHTDIPEHCKIAYFGKPLDLRLPKDSCNELSIGHVLLTKSGTELARVCPRTLVDGFFEFVREEHYARLLANSENPTEEIDA